MQTSAKVLIAEDSLVLRERYRKIFERILVTLTLAEDGWEALEKIKREHFHLIITDIMMPRMDGFEFTRQARALPEYRDVPVFVVSSKKQEEDLHKAWAVGVTEYIFKPFEGDRLLSIVRHYLGL